MYKHTRPSAVLSLYVLYCISSPLYPAALIKVFVKKIIDKMIPHWSGIMLVLTLDWVVGDTVVHYLQCKD